MPNVSEVASIIVGGQKFEDWENVWVQHRWTEAFPLFRFTAAERDNLPPLWQRLQFKPGDECAIYLGGYLAITGIIITRQTAYDATNHGVLLQGKGITWAATRASILSKTGSYDGKTFEQVAREVFAPTGVGVRTIGQLNATPFQRLQNTPGEPIWDFLERIARPKGIILGSDHLGNILLIDNHSMDVSGTLTEGVNILKCQATVSIEHIFSKYDVGSQGHGTDEQYGPKISEMYASAAGSLKRYSPLYTPSEHPVWNLAELGDRARNESIWHEGTIVEASITVQGWLRDGVALWEAGSEIKVKSPMAMLDMVMKVNNVTFTQDRNSGTLTTLDLVAPWLLKSRTKYNVGNPAAPQEPGEATPDTNPPATPPAQKPPEPPPLLLIS